MLSSLDFAVIAVYLSFVLFIGWRCSKGNKTSEDYFMAGRSISWLPIALSVAATTLSANGFVGGPGWAYSSGLFAFMMQIAIPLAVAFVIYTTLPACYYLRLTSIYDYVELRLGPRTHLLTVLGFFGNALIQIGSMVFVPALMISYFTGWDLTLVVPVVVLTAVGYTLLGGMRAVIWTDVSQMIVMWTGLFCILAIVLSSLESSPSAIFEAAKASGKLASLDFSFRMDSPNTFWATLIGGFVMWLNYFGFNQVQIQRVLTAKSLKDAKGSFLSSSIIMNTMYFILICMGILLYLFYEGIPFENANVMVPHFISNYMVQGFRGLLVAGVFAAAMSSVDSLFNAMTTVFTKNVYEKHFAPDQGPASLHVSMLISCVFGILVIFVALAGFSKNVESVLRVVGNYISYISGPMAGVYLLSFFAPFANDKGVAWGTLLGFGGVILFCNYFQIGWIWKPAVGLLFTLGAALPGCFLFRKHASSQKGKEYTLGSILERQKASRKIYEGKESLLPFTFDGYVMGALLFFGIQYVVLFSLQ